MGFFSFYFSHSITHFRTQLYVNSIIFNFADSGDSTYTVLIQTENKYGPYLWAMVSTVLCLNLSRIVFCRSMSVLWSTLAVASSIHKTYKEDTQMLPRYSHIGLRNEKTQETICACAYIGVSQKSPSKTQQLPLANWKILSSLSHCSLQPSW